MDERVRERRRAVSRERGRRRAGIIFACLALVVVAGLFVWLRSSDVFAVRTVTATQLQHVTTEDIRRATASARGVSLLALSVGPIEENLTALPYVRSVRVIRRFPHTLEVQVVERTPIARVQAGDGTIWLASDDGLVLERKNDAGLPLFVTATKLDLKAGGQLPAQVAQVLPLVTLIEQMPETEGLPEVAHVAIALTGEVVVYLADGIELRLGEPTQLKQKLTVSTGIVQQYLRDGKHIEYVDASVVDRVAVNAE